MKIKKAKVSIVAIVILFFVININNVYAIRATMSIDKNGNDKIEVFGDKKNKNEYIRLLKDRTLTREEDIELIEGVKNNEKNRDLKTYRYAFIEPLESNDKTYEIIKGFKPKNRKGMKSIIDLSNYMAEDLGMTYGMGVDAYKQIESIKNRSTKCLGFTWLAMKMLDNTDTTYRLVFEENISYKTGTHIYIEYLDVDNKWKPADFSLIGTVGQLDKDGKFIFKLDKKTRIYNIKCKNLKTKPTVDYKKGNYVVRYYSTSIKNGKFLENSYPHVNLYSY